jgi:sulfotransferase
MERAIHFISGLPRSGSTLLAAILRQNPNFHAGMTSPVAFLFRNLLGAMRAEHEWSVLIDQQQRQRLLRSLFDGYYGSGRPQQVIFDTNRSWCSKMPALGQLFPGARVIACVRDLPWIIDSFERVVRRNPLLMSRLFTPERSKTVYDRVEHLMSSSGPVGFAWNALREAFYGEEARQLVFVDYEALTVEPQRTLERLYDLLDLPRFRHDFEHVSFVDGDEFDACFGAPGLHSVAAKVRFVERATILPPDIVNRFANRCFWRNAQGDPRGVSVLLPTRAEAENGDTRPAAVVSPALASVIAGAGDRADGQAAALMGTAR